MPGHLGNEKRRTWHSWQNESPKHHTREFTREDYCGYRLEMPDGSILIKSFKIMKKRQEADGLRMDVLNVSVFYFIGICVL